MDAVVERIVELSARTLGSPRASLWAQEMVGGDVRVGATHGYSEVDNERLARLRFPHELAHEHLSDREPFVVSDDQFQAIPGMAELAVRRPFAIAPVTLDGGRLGCIVVAAPSDAEFTERQLRLLAGVAHQSKLALANAGNFDNLERTFLETVEALANALEANDEYTSSHARWITDLALKVGEELGLEGSSLKRLELGALFHDIGKIGIPETILAKPGPLTSAEREVVETHPELGEKIIAPIDRLEEVRPIVRHCHERYDGDGYPDRLSGDDIPIESRIILVCDAYHAMTTDRPYRKRLPADEALRRLQEAAGTQFDPRVVEVCTRVLASPGAAALPSALPAPR
jgi:HD-GYP domain-containing protein (c-di-GMP phosphodiesterase class II)